MPARKSLGADFDEIYRREFLLIDANKAYSSLNLYAGTESLREFDLASRLSLVRAGKTIHQFRQKATSDKVSDDLNNDLCVVTFASDRVMVDKEQPTAQLRNRPFYLAKGASRRSRGFRVNPEANLEDRYDQARWIAQNEQAIDQALNAGANIVCLGEFDFPPVDVDGSLQDRTESLAANMAHRRWILQRLAALGRPAFVFAGSSHCWTRKGTSCANIGRIFIADYDGNSPNMVAHYLRYEKRVPAKGLGESLAQVPTPVLPYFGTSLGKIGVLICVDAFDPGIITSIFANSRDNGIDRLGVILVPSYNPSHKLLMACQQLSYLANCAVVYVNALSTARHDKAQVFLSGISLKVWRAQLDNVKKMVESKTKLDPRIVEAIPGVRSLPRLIHLADLGRDIRVEAVGVGEQLMKWVIPHGLLSEAANLMTAKYPFNRGRMIASLAVDDE